MISTMKQIKILRISNPSASGLGYGGILKQKISHDSKEQIVRYHFGVWHASQQKYSTIKKEILSIVLCLQKFQDDL